MPSRSTSQAAPAFSSTTRMRRSQSQFSRTHPDTSNGVPEMSSSTATVQAPPSRVETGALLGQTMGLVALTSGLFALGAYLGRDISGGWAIGSFIAAFALLLGINAATQRSEQLAVAFLFRFGLLLGLAVAPTVAYYAGADPQAV